MSCRPALRMGTGSCRACSLAKKRLIGEQQITMSHKGLSDTQAVVHRACIWP